MEIKRTGLWIGRQAARMCLMVLLVSILAFGLLAASPIDPLQTNVGQTALGSMSPEQIARLRSYWGTDLPPVERYLNWLKDFLHGNMGTSLLYRRPVAEVIVGSFPEIEVLFQSHVQQGIGPALFVLLGAFRGTTSPAARPPCPGRPQVRPGPRPRPGGPRRPGPGGHML